ncbi:MAG: ABC transporter substrate-binding protein [Treponema sp.]|nr:ABC transporter substrate-binding protein [Treponema sp.]
MSPKTLKQYFLILFISCLCLCAFSQATSIRLGFLKGISCAPCAFLCENRDKLAIQNMTFQIFDSERSELPELLKGRLDMAFLSPETAIKVHGKSPDSLKVVGIAQKQNYFLITSDKSYKNLEDLQGKTIICAGEKSPALFLMKSLTEKKGISVNFDFSIPEAEIANALSLEKIQYAILSEPFATVALRSSSKLFRAENLQKSWAEANPQDFFTPPALLLVVRSDFAKENRSLVSKFADIYKDAVQWTSKNPYKAAILAEKHGLGLNLEVTRRSIPQANFAWYGKESLKNEIEKYSATFGWQAPSDDFYF